MVSPPIRQKDRIAELEAKLEEVTKLLQLQQLQGPSPGVSSEGSARSPTGHDAGHAAPKAAERSSKKRRLQSASIVDGLEAPQDSSPSQSNTVLAIDHVISREVQQQILHKYHNEFEASFPFPITQEYETLREKFPLLLLSVISAACVGVVPDDVQDELTSIIMKLLAPEKIVKANK
jgi:hypothetical protein